MTRAMARRENAEVRLITSAVNLKFLSVSLRFHHRNFKFKTALGNGNLLELL